MNNLPRIHKTSERYSEQNRPKVGQVCIFSPAKKLIPGMYSQINRVFYDEHIKKNKLCVVKRLTKKNLCEVQFDHMKDPVLVSPVFLMKRELTTFGKKLFGGLSMV